MRNMVLYHSTNPKNVPSILREGLLPNGLGIVYLSPSIETATWGEAILEVEVGGLKLTAFEDCSEWEVLCWGTIPPESIKQIGGVKEWHEKLGIKSVNVDIDE